jgi:hypothetical protein
MEKIVDTAANNISRLQRKLQLIMEYKIRIEIYITRIISRFFQAEKELIPFLHKYISGLNQRHSQTPEIEQLLNLDRNAQLENSTFCDNLQSQSSTLLQKDRSETFLSQSVATQDRDDRGDVPGWVLVVLMTAGLVTGIWTVAAPRLNLILRNSLDSMNSIR